MPHQCVHCGKIYPVATKALLEGCDDCKGKFFFYIREEQLKKLTENPVEQIPLEDKKQIELDVREMAGIVKEDVPVILDFESVRVTGSGKFEIDIINLFTKKRPLIYKLEEGKYIIDLISSLNQKKEGEQNS